MCIRRFLFFFIFAQLYLQGQWARVEVNSVRRLCGAAFPQRSHATVVGGAFDQFVNGEIISTTNGGSSWGIIRAPGGSPDWRAVSFSDSSQGVVVGGVNIDLTNEGVVLRTTDAGTTWHVLGTQTTWHGMWLYGVCVIDSINISVASSFGLYRSTDGGTTWINQSWTDGLRAVSYFGLNNGIAVGRGGIIYTANSGLNWKISVSGLTVIFHGVAFPSAGSAYAVGSDGTIVKSTNGGETWTGQFSGTSAALYGVDFSNDLVGVAVGAGGVILKTTDGGNNWALQQSGTTATLYAVAMADSINAIACGEGGTILKTNNGGISSAYDVDPLSSHEFHIMQNYPNPFNPVTRISYSVPSELPSPAGEGRTRPGGADRVRLVVFDVLGREVAVLVNEEKPAGQYTVSFDAASLPSGTYYYELRAGEFRAVKKMILLR